MTETTKTPVTKAMFLRRGIAGLLLLLLTIGSVIGLAASAHADDDIDRLSFYNVSGELVDLFSQLQQPDIEESFDDEGWDEILSNPGSAGSFLGYSDSAENWMTSILSGSSSSMSYDSLSAQDSDGGSQAAHLQGFQFYALYGATLSALGLDSTTTGLSMNFGGMIGGGIMLILYLFSYVVDFIFQTVLAVLSFLNPFRFFDEAVRNATETDIYADGMTGGEGVPGFLQGLSSWIAGWYGVLYEMAWNVIVPLFIGTFLIGLVLFKKMNRGSALKKLAIRLLFIGLGLPLMGSMFTAALDSMSDEFSGGRSGATQVVMSTFVDFESWVENGRLAVPPEATLAWNTDTGGPTGESQANVRNTALAINNQSHGLDLADIVTGETAGTWTEAALETSDEDVSTDADTDQFGLTLDMLNRYMDGAQVTASGYETEVKSWWSNHVDNAEVTVGWFRSITGNRYDPGAGFDEGYSPTSDGMPDANYSAHMLRHNPVVSVQHREGQPVGLQANSDGTVYEYYTAGGGNRKDMTDCGSSWSSVSSRPANCNLSPLAMYNYLNTGFGSGEMTMYSSGNVMSEATREIHSSVNLVGTGSMSALYLVNSMVLLGAFVILGLTFALAMVFATIRRGVQLISAIPFATLGAIAGIAKVIIYSLAMVIEVLLTIFVYLFLQQMLLSLPQIIEYPFSQILNDDNGAGIALVAFLASGPVITVLVTVISIIATVAFTIMALRVRKTIIKAADEAVTKLVEKFLDTSALPATAGDGPSGMGHAIGSGAGGAASMAAAGRVATGGQQKAAPAKNVGGTNGGPADVSSTPGAAAGPGGGSDSQGGSGGGGTGGSGGPGSSGAPGLSSMGRASDDQAYGLQVEKSGLSMDGQGHDAAGAKSADSGDVLDDASQSASESAQGYREADKQRLSAGKDVAAAGVHGTKAVGRGIAGDSAGAAAEGSKAVSAGAEATAKGKDAKAIEKQAGASTLEKADGSAAKDVAAAQEQAAGARQVSAAADQAGTVAGQASAVSGAEKAAESAGESAAKGVAAQSSTVSSTEEKETTSSSSDAQTSSQTSSERDSAEQRSADSAQQAPAKGVSADGVAKPVQTGQPTEEGSTDTAAGSAEQAPGQGVSAEPVAKPVQAEASAKEGAATNTAESSSERSPYEKGAQVGESGPEPQTAASGAPVVADTPAGQAQGGVQTNIAEDRSVQNMAEETKLDQDVTENTSDTVSKVSEEKPSPGQGTVPAAAAAAGAKQAAQEPAEQPKRSADAQGTAAAKDAATVKGAAAGDAQPTPKRSNGPLGTPKGIRAGAAKAKDTGASARVVKPTQRTAKGGSAAAAKAAPVNRAATGQKASGVVPDKAAVGVSRSGLRRVGVPKPKPQPQPKASAAAKGAGASVPAVKPRTIGQPNPARFRDAKTADGRSGAPSGLKPGAPSRPQRPSTAAAAAPKAKAAATPVQPVRKPRRVGPGPEAGSRDE